MESKIDATYETTGSETGNRVVDMNPTYAADYISSD